MVNLACSLAGFEGPQAENICWPDFEKLQNSEFWLKSVVDLFKRLCCWASGVSVVKIHKIKILNLQQIRPDGDGDTLPTSQHRQCRKFLLGCHGCQSLHQTVFLKSAITKSHSLAIKENKLSQILHVRAP